MPRRPLPDRAEYLGRWSALHGGYDPRRSRFVYGWLSLAYVAARPLAAARVPPDLVSLATMPVAGLVAVLAAAGGRWCLVGVVVVVASGLLDNLDGAVAVLTDRVTRFGDVLDSVADRVSDGLYVVALWLLGAPGSLAAAGGAATLLQEYARARAKASGMSEVGVVTVAERPTRVLVTAFTLAGVGVAPSRTEDVALLGVGAWTLLAVVGLAQLLVVVRRRLR